MKKTNWAVLILVAVLVCVLWLADGYVRWRGIMSIQDQVSSTITEKENEPTQHQITTEKENAEMSGTIGGEGTVRKATTDWTFLSCPDYVDYVGAAEKPGATGETEPKAAVVLPLKQPTLEKTFTEGSVDALEHDSCYTLVLDELPLGFLSEGTQSVAVVYPAEIAPGEAGKFQVWTEIYGQCYCATLAVKAEDYVRLVHGSSDPNTYSGGEIDYDEQTRTLKVYFFTSATEEHLQRPRCISRSSVYGYLKVAFTRESGVR